MEEDERRADSWNVYSWKKMKGGLIGGTSSWKKMKGGLLGGISSWRKMKGGLIGGMSFGWLNTMWRR